MTPQDTSRIASVRNDYLTRFRRAIASYAQQNRIVHTEICLELPAPKRHPLYRLFVVDVLERLLDGSNNVIEINVEPISIALLAFTVDAPTAWNGIEFRCKPFGFPEEALVAWGMRWITDQDPPCGQQEEFTGIIHSVTTPTITDGLMQFTVDFGSAPVEAFEELTSFMSAHIQSLGSYSLA
jgi:hypothetical protein